MASAAAAQSSNSMFKDIFVKYSSYRRELHVNRVILGGVLLLNSLFALRQQSLIMMMSTRLIDVVDEGIPELHHRDSDRKYLSQYHIV